ncbi:MAG: dihydrodipicolinate synthase family protein [Actinomycetota bacterium]|nr:dihydrodipicolinate synthase family protein [Actinomycetota bacterium]
MLYPRFAVSCISCLSDGKLDQAKDLHMELFQINGRVSGANAVAGVKSAATICGYNGGDPRRPLIPLTQEQKEQMNKFFEQKGLI